MRLSGGSGFVASHILSLLLERGHSVVTTVRNADRADEIRQLFSTIPESILGIEITGDIREESAFETAVQADPPFDVVVGNDTVQLIYLNDN